LRIGRFEDWAIGLDNRAKERTGDRAILHLILDFGICLDFVWILVLGFWNLFGFWCLEFGIFKGRQKGLHDSPPILLLSLQTFLSISNCQTVCKTNFKKTGNKIDLRLFQF
jgi:hypothetical protein